LHAKRGRRKIPLTTRLLREAEIRETGLSTQGGMAEKGKPSAAHKLSLQGWSAVERILH